MRIKRKEYDKLTEDLNNYIELANQRLQELHNATRTHNDLVKQLGEMRRALSEREASMQRVVKALNPYLRIDVG